MAHKVTVETEKNYRVVIRIDNFETESAELSFGDFTIKKIKPGSEAAELRRRLNCKRVPRYVLIKDFPNYVAEEDDLSGFDGIVHEIMDLLLVFRLFKCGDVFFNDMIIEDQDTHNSYNSLYKMDNLSAFRYFFDTQHIQGFVDFRNTIVQKIKHRSKFMNYCLDKYLSGANREFHFRKESLHRIVDYVIALESVFLIDNSRFFLRRTLANRVSRFIEDSDVIPVVKYMYDERSKIVHGSNINMDERSEKQLQEKLKELMPRFESLMKMVLIKLLGLQFNTKKEIENHMKSLYAPPAGAVDIMNAAAQRAEEYLSD